MSDEVLNPISEEELGNPRVEKVPAEKWDEFAQPLYQRMLEADVQYGKMGEELETLDLANKDCNEQYQQFLEKRSAFYLSLKEKTGDKYLEVIKSDPDAIEWENKFLQKRQASDTARAKYWETNESKDKLRSVRPDVLKLLWNSCDNSEIDIERPKYDFEYYHCDQVKFLPDGNAIHHGIWTASSYGDDYPVEDWVLLNKEAQRELANKIVQDSEQRIQAETAHLTHLNQVFVHILGDTK